MFITFVYRACKTTTQFFSVCQSRFWARQTATPIDRWQVGSLTLPSHMPAPPSVPTLPALPTAFVSSPEHPSTFLQPNPFCRSWPTPKTPPPALLLAKHGAERAPSNGPSPYSGSARAGQRSGKRVRGVVHQITPRPSLWLTGYYCFFPRLTVVVIEPVVSLGFRLCLVGLEPFLVMDFFSLKTIIR